MSASQATEAAVDSTGDCSLIERLARLFIAPDTIVIVSRLRDQCLVDVNQAFERIVGIPRADAVGRTAMDLGLWRDQRARQAIFDMLQQRGRLVREPVAVRARDGTYYDGLMSCEIVVQNDEQYAFAMFQDIRRYDDQVQSHTRELESFRSLFEEAEIGVYRRWPRGRGYVDVNPSIVAMLGYESPEQLMTERRSDVASVYADPDHGAWVHATLKREGRISRVHSMLRRRDGSTFWVSESAHAVHGADGSVLFYEGTLADIGREVAAQGALEQSERLYRSLVDNCRDGVFLMQHGVIAFCNDALARALDFTAPELLGTSYLKHIDPADLPAQQRRLAARESGSMDVQAYEVRLLRKDGVSRLFEVRAGAVIFRGEPASTGTIRDVTELHAQQARLAEAEERYRNAIWGSGDRLFEWDMQAGVLTPIPTDPERELDVAFAMPSPEGLSGYVHAEDLPAYVASIENHLSGQTDYFEATYRIWSRTASEWKWKLARGMIVARDAAGRPLRISGMQKDISKIKTAETALLDLTRDLDARVQERTCELQEERRELEAANQQLTTAIDALQRTQNELIESEKMASLGRLVAGVAHEVNTPLGVGLTAISFLRDQLAGVARALALHMRPEDVDALIAPVEKAGAMTQTNLMRAANMVRSFKQVAVDQSTVSIRTVGVRDYLEGILQSLHPILKQHGHLVRIDCDPLLQMVSRPDALYQVVANLVVNSIAHAFPEHVVGTIRIGVGVDSNMLHLRYEDDGVGMDALVARRVFEPFFTTRRELGGTGLGMHIVYNLVTQALAGRIALATDPGRGVRFDMWFPVVHPDANMLLSRPPGSEAPKTHDNAAGKTR